MPPWDVQDPVCWRDNSPISSESTCGVVCLPTFSDVILAHEALPAAGASTGVLLVDANLTVDLQDHNTVHKEASTISLRVLP